MKEPAPGVIITGKYRLESPLARGGMGSVWTATHIELGVPVAIKFMAPEVVSSTDARGRFEREAKAAAIIHSPHVVHIQDYGVDDSLPYIVMELMRGEDLEQRLQRQGRLRIDETFALLQPIAKGLRRAHDLGIIHRDLKPRNIFLVQHDDDQIVKILDFGIAKSTGAVLDDGQTRSGVVLGSPAYMSPEQLHGARDIDARTDLWSLGVILFRALVGTPPFAGETIEELVAKILFNPIPQPTHLAPDLSPAIDVFFKRALARDRKHRFSSARELLHTFADIAGAPGSWSPSYAPPLPNALGLSENGRVSSYGDRDESGDSRTIIYPATTAPGAHSTNGGTVTRPAIIDMIDAPKPRASGGKAATAGLLIVVAAATAIVVARSWPTTTSVAATATPSQPAPAPMASDTNPNSAPTSTATAAIAGNALVPAAPVQPQAAPSARSSNADAPRTAPVVVKPRLEPAASTPTEAPKATAAPTSPTLNPTMAPVDSPQNVPAAAAPTATPMTTADPAAAPASAPSAGHVIDMGLGGSDGP